MEPSPPEAKRSKRSHTHSGEDRAKNHVSKPLSLLIRLSQGCIRHQQTCHPHHVEDSDKCDTDMKKLAQLVPKIEATCRDAQDISHREVLNLALFYISVVQGTYCPHSLQQIFQGGKQGVESKS